MFWKFNFTPSRIDSLLDKQDITLHEIMEEDDVVQECKSQNRKLVDFLVQPQNMEALVNMVTSPPTSETEEKLRFRFPNVACELLTSDVMQITDTLATTDLLLNTVYSFLERDEELNPLQASFFSKIMGLLITRKSELMVEYIKSRDGFVKHLLRHLSTSAIMDLLLRLITCVEPIECRNDCINWLNDQQLVSLLVAAIDKSETAEKHTNAAQSLCDIIRLSREQQVASHMLENNPGSSDSLLKSVETRETVSTLLDHMFTEEPVESVIVNGLYVIQTLLEVKKVSIETYGECLSLTDQTSSSLPPSAAVTNTLDAIVPRLQDFHNLLLHPPKQHYMPMPSTSGLLETPLGLARLQVARLVSTLIHTSSEQINAMLAQLGTVGILLDLFFQYSWNNFLHAQVEQCLSGIVNSQQENNPLQTQLFCEFHLLERMASSFDEHKCQRTRRGYYGHLTRIANQLVGSVETPHGSLQSPESGNNLQAVKAIVSELPEAVRDQWEACIGGALSEINKLNTVELVSSSGGGGPPSSSDDDDDFRNIAFPQDDALQKAFSDYQMQQMTSNFVDQFGFSEEDFAEQEETVGSPFSDRISGINFELNMIEDSPASAALFEQACNDRIRQFDSADSDEELEINFSPISDKRHSSVLPRLNGKPAKASGRRYINEDDDEDDFDTEIVDHGVRDEERGTGGGSAESTDSEEDLSSPRFIHQAATGSQSPAVRTKPFDTVNATRACQSKKITENAADKSSSTDRVLSKEENMMDTCADFASMTITTDVANLNSDSHASSGTESTEKNSLAISLDEINVDVDGSSVDSCITSADIATNNQSAVEDIKCSSDNAELVVNPAMAQNSAVSVVDGYSSALDTQSAATAILITNDAAIKENGLPEDASIVTQASECTSANLTNHIVETRLSAITEAAAAATCEETVDNAAVIKSKINNETMASAGNDSMADISIPCVTKHGELRIVPLPMVAGAAIQMEVNAANVSSDSNHTTMA